MKETLRQWHRFIETQDAESLGELLEGDVKFHSPFVWAPKEGKPVVTAILVAASQVLEDFEYVREVVDGEDAVLEFKAKVGEFELRGVDIIKINSNGKIIDFEVMVRPANALQALGSAMSAKLGL